MQPDDEFYIPEACKGEIILAGECMKKANEYIEHGRIEKYRIGYERARNHFRMAEQIFMDSLKIDMTTLNNV